MRVDSAAGAEEVRHEILLSGEGDEEEEEERETEGEWRKL